VNAPAAAPSTLAPGTILAGKYRVTRILGQGGMGVVVEAQHIQLDDRVALKFLLPEYANHPEASERFLREARAAVKIKSEHVARVSDVGTLDTGSPYMVMEYLQGEDLSNMLEKSGPLNVQDAVDFIIQGCEAINEAHGYGIVHRDIKPANLFVTRRQDGSPLVKVLDFGISKTMGSGVDGLTRTTATMGSALYMSPEQMRQSKGVDHRTDIYSLGITLYELLAGKQPFYANTLPELCAEVLTGSPTPLLQVRQDVSSQFAVVLERGYARERDHRYQTVSEFVFALAPFGDRSLRAPRAGRTASRGRSPSSGIDDADRAQRIWGGSAQRTKRCCVCVEPRARQHREQPSRDERRALHDRCEASEVEWGRCRGGARALCAYRRRRGRLVLHEDQVCRCIA
jgi:eukaryotic-like serine/threonine-protein kinase